MKKQWIFEILSWIFILVFALLFVIPIYFKIGSVYQFYVRNIVSIVVFLTLTRYIFLLKFTPFARTNWMKIVLIFIPIPLFFYHLDSLYDFRRFLDEEGTASLFDASLNLGDYNFGKYIKFQYLLFCIGAIISIFAIPIRMIISLWRTTNTEHKI